MKKYFLPFFLLTINLVSAQQLAVLKYNGGGDWYANPTALPNLIKFSNANNQTKLSENVGTVTPGSTEIFDYAYIDMTGHGNVFFSDDEALNLKNYLISGGFLHISDNYGLDKYIRREMKKVFPKLNFVEIPYDHPIFHQKFDFKNGLPKIHEHDGKPAQGFGIFYKGRMLVFYDYECDLGDGWEVAEVHHDPLQIRTKALQMGANILTYIFNN
ncbi:MAG: DUF4159 domain-containing protein [Flavobacteriaceae bacterium]|nr:DUF4159 domain-containing protein [Flavobacteriaceae bacterium]